MPNKLTPPPATGNSLLDRWLALLWRLLTADGQINWNQLGGGSTPYIPLDTTAGEPTRATGQIFWDDTNKTVAAHLEGADVTLQIGQENHVFARNATGSTILNGKAVYVSGAQGNRPRISLAKADAASTSVGMIGLATEDIENTTDGYVTTQGLVNGIDTSSFNEGDTVFLSATTAGELTSTEPTGHNYIVRVGTVTRVNPTVGAILVNVQLITRDSTEIAVAHIGNSTFSNLQHYVNLSQSAGRITGGSLSDAGSANLNVASGAGWLRIADDDVSDLKFFDWAASNGNAIPVSTTRYVGVEYNAGSPRVVIKTTDTWDTDTEFPLGEVSNEAGTLHIINNPFWVGDSITNIIQRFSAIQHVQRDNLVGGLTLGETGTRNITVSASKIWSRLNDFTFNAFNSSTGGTFDRYYRNGSGGFTREVAQTQWPNTQYDDGSGTLVTMTNNRYANLWFYAETDGDVVMLYGQNQYTSASAAEVGAPPTTLPERLRSTGILIGRIIFQKSASTATIISSAFTTVFNPTAATDHALLSNLQGGAVGELYHLTAAQVAAIGTGGGGAPSNVINSDTTVAADTSYIVMSYLTLNANFIIAGNVGVL